MRRQTTLGTGRSRDGREKPCLPVSWLSGPGPSASWAGHTSDPWQGQRVSSDPEWRTVSTRDGCRCEPQSLGAVTQPGPRALWSLLSPQRRAGRCRSPQPPPPAPRRGAGTRAVRSEPGSVHRALCPHNPACAATPPHSCSSGRHHLRKGPQRTSKPGRGCKQLLRDTLQETALLT